MRHFAGTEHGDDRIPEETTILNFHYLPEWAHVTQSEFANVNAHLADKGARCTPEHLVYAFINYATLSMKNKARASDPEPGANVRTFCARQPVLDATEVGGMKRSPSKIEKPPPW